MTVLTLVAVLPAMYALCALVHWICWLRLVRHVHDTSGAAAVQYLSSVVRAYRAPSAESTPPGPAPLDPAAAHGSSAEAVPPSSPVS